jgi:hypothetical protein
MSRTGLQFSPDTRRRLRELFAGRCCKKCGAAAVRLSADRYYRAAHYPRKLSGPSVGTRVYRCWADERQAG